MTIYFRDFAGDTVGALPSDIDHYHKGVNNWTLTVEEINGVRGLRFNPGSSGSDTQFAQFLTPGDVSNAADKEIVAHFRVLPGESVANSIPTVMLNQVRDLVTPDGNGYAIRWIGASSNWQIQRIGTSGDSLSNRLTLSPTPFALTVDQICRVRFRFKTDGTLRARIVQGDTDSVELAVINTLLAAASLPTVGSIDAAKDIAAAWHGSVNDSLWRSTGYFSIGHTSHQSETFFPLVGMATAGETAPTTGYSIPTVTNAGDEVHVPGETGIAVTGTNFGPSQGSGRVYLCATNNVSDSGRVEQTVTSWSSTSVVFTCVAGALPRATTLYLFVVNAGGYSNATGYGVLIPVTGPAILDAGDETYTAGETGIVVTGTGFGATQGDGLVLLSPTNDSGDGAAVEQTVTSWSDTSITFTCVKGSLTFLTPMYLFVINNAAEANSNGYAVQLVPRVYVQENVRDLGGNAVALNGEALLIWRARPTAGNPNPDQVITLGSIPSGNINQEINRGSLAVNAPVWCMLVGASSNSASAKRIVPTYQ